LRLPSAHESDERCDICKITTVGLR
jgi:hypothetical protein